MKFQIYKGRDLQNLLDLDNQFCLFADKAIDKDFYQDWYPSLEPVLNLYGALADYDEDSYAIKKVVGESRRLTFKQAAQTLRIWVAMVSESQDEFLEMLETLAPVLSWYEKLGEDYTITFSF